MKKMNDAKRPTLTL